MSSRRGVVKSWASSTSVVDRVEVYMERHREQYGEAGEARQSFDALRHVALARHVTL